MSESASIGVNRRHDPTQLPVWVSKTSPVAQTAIALVHFDGQVVPVAPDRCAQFTSPKPVPVAIVSQGRAPSPYANPTTESRRQRRDGCRFGVCSSSRRQGRKRAIQHLGSVPSAETQSDCGGQSARTGRPCRGNNASDNECDEGAVAEGVREEPADAGEPAGTGRGDRFRRETSNSRHRWRGPHSGQPADGSRLPGRGRRQG